MELILVIILVILLFGAASSIYRGSYCGRPYRSSSIGGCGWRRTAL